MIVRLYAVLIAFMAVSIFAQDTPTVQVKTIADLVALRIPLVNNRLSALVTGRTTENDGGGGMFFYQSGSTATTNLGTIFKPTATTGRWFRKFDGPLNVKWFGAIPDDSTDNYMAFTNALHVSTNVAREVYAPGGSSAYRFNTGIVLPAYSNGRLYGSKEGATELRFYGSGVFFTSSGTGAENGAWAFENLFFKSADANTSSTHGLVLTNAHEHGRLINCFFDGWRNTGSRAVWINRSYGFYINKLRIGFCYEALWLGDVNGGDFINNTRVETVTIEGCESTNYVARIARADSVQLLNVLLQSNDSGVLVQDSRGVTLNLDTEENGIGTSLGNADLFLKDNESVVVFNSVFDGHDAGASDYAGIKIGRTSVGSTGPVIRDTTIRDYASGIKYQDAQGDIKSAYLDNVRLDGNTADFTYTTAPNAGEYTVQMLNGLFQWRNNAGTLTTIVDGESALLGGGNRFNRKSQACGYVMTATDFYVRITSTGAATLPDASDAGSGRTVIIKSASGVTTTVTAASGDTVEGAATDSLASLASAIYISDGAGNWEKN